MSSFGVSLISLDLPVKTDSIHGHDRGKHVHLLINFVFIVYDLQLFQVTIISLHRRGNKGFVKHLIMS
ncbi:MAG TPA: hypothetical protein VFT78_14115 [Hanamia sp.]|nr:hypothetical protein [Hanamia sp.]